RVVGFTDSRSGGTVGQADKRVTGKSHHYASYTSETKTDSEGVARLIAPTVNDIQTVTVQNDDGESISVSNLKIEKSGANMGTIALVGKDQYNLKVTGTIDESYKTDGYMFANTEYPMTLTIKNISDITATTSILTIESDNPAVTVVSKDNENLSAMTVGTLAGGGTKMLNLGVTCSDIDKGYVDALIKIRIVNVFEGSAWEDYVPLRFHSGWHCFTVNAQNPDGNANASLKGYIIYPDGNSQYFSVNHNQSTTIAVPAFGDDEPFLMAFCGAAANADLFSTEMHYTVISGAYPLAINDSLEEYRSHVLFAEPNDTQDRAFTAESAFQAYLHAGDIDYYKVTADDNNKVIFNLDNQDADSAGSANVIAVLGTSLSNITVPTKAGYIFGGYWTEPNGCGMQYIDENGNGIWFVDTLDDKTLYAKWTVSASPSMPTDTTSDSSDDTSGATTTSTTTTTTTIGGGQVSLTVTGNIKIGNVEYDKTSFVKVMDTAVIVTGSDDNWSSYLDSRAFNFYKGVFISDRTVKISPYYMAQYQVTQQLYEAVMNSGKNYGFGKSDTHPAYYVSWYDAITFCNKLSLLMGRTPCYTVNGITDWAGLAYSSIPASNNSTWNAAECDITKNGYRLPTEAEWEFAARGGDPSKADWKYAFSGIDVVGGNKIHDGSSYLKTDANLATVGWYSSNSGSSTHPVGEKLPNRLGLYDMSGNILEWCQDRYNETVTSNDTAWTVNGVVTDPQGAAFNSSRVQRGSMWNIIADSCCVSYRQSNSSFGSNTPITYCGFRLACSVR
ncbi:MAG: SUMF1/EgtB/PvdO family nonheme iron enzyme, partial [Spirochaetales bacterium]|nr:SUMF1/EgtB/PvdO family nonheme iron enzyme [Spirochaetales bacterium]